MAEKITFKMVAKEYASGKRWADKYRGAFWNRLEIHVPFMDTDIKKIKEKTVFEIMKKPEGNGIFWNEKNATAVEVLRSVLSVMDYALAFDYLKMKDFSVGSVKTMVDKGLSPRTESENYQALDYKRLPAIAKRLRDMARSGDEGAAFVLFLMLTAVRYSEAAGAKRIEFYDGFWKIPRERMKGRQDRKKPHTVPIPEHAYAATIKNIPGEDMALFPGMYPNKAKRILRAVCREIICQEDLSLADLCDSVVPHGLRSSFATWAAQEQRHISAEAVEEALSHTLNNAVRARYTRNAEDPKGPVFLEIRKELMQAWMEFLFF